MPSLDAQPSLNQLKRISNTTRNSELIDPSHVIMQASLPQVEATALRHEIPLDRKKKIGFLSVAHRPTVIQYHTQDRALQEFAGLKEAKDFPISEMASKRFGLADVSR